MGQAGPARKKWTKGKAREKTNNAVIYDQETYDRLMKEVPKLKLITASVLVDRLKINVSLAKRSLKDLCQKGLIREVSTHRSQVIYTRATAGSE